LILSLIQGFVLFVTIIISLTSLYVDIDNLALLTVFTNSFITVSQQHISIDVFLITFSTTTLPIFFLVFSHFHLR
jgi:hypothetical protein